jgi:hypothetical protein
MRLLTRPPAYKSSKKSLTTLERKLPGPCARSPELADGEKATVTGGDRRPIERRLLNATWTAHLERIMNGEAVGYVIIFVGILQSWQYSSIYTLRHSPRRDAPVERPGQSQR